MVTEQFHHQSSSYFATLVRRGRETNGEDLVPPTYYGPLAANSDWQYIDLTTYASTGLNSLFYFFGINIGTWGMACGIGRGFILYIYFSGIKLMYVKQQKSVTYKFNIRKSRIFCMIGYSCHCPLQSSQLPPSRLVQQADCNLLHQHETAGSKYGRERA